jgi:L-seryl-tRNA(Ser) seleniumtransferase
VDALATSLDSGSLPRSLLVEVARRSIERSRSSGDDPAALARAELNRLEGLRPRPVINATGVLLHTNLGRARQAPEAVKAAAEAAAHASPVEFDVNTGGRGGRGAYAESLLTSLTGAEAALAVNNNAGALLLALAALGGGRGAVVSRGELIEIGGSFRLPDLMGASGASMQEVGTTNRTRLRDYRKAIDDSTALLLKVHPSNYRIEGFTEEAAYAELGALAADHGILFVADVGSGLLDARVPWIDGPPPPWLASEPAVRQTLDAGASVVLFSGDKLLGGPQAGIAVGTAAAIDEMRSHPLTRALRLAGPSIDSLGATLEMYASGRGAEIPFWTMASLSAESLEDRARVVLEAAGVDAAIVEGRSLPGAGTVPGAGIPGPVILVAGDAETIWRRLLDNPTPVVARRDERGLVVDLRSVEPDDDDRLAAALGAACR